MNWGTSQVTLGVRWAARYNPIYMFQHFRSFIIYVNRHYWLFDLASMTKYTYYVMNPMTQRSPSGETTRWATGMQEWRHCDICRTSERSTILLKSGWGQWMGALRELQRFSRCDSCIMNWLHHRWVTFNIVSSPHITSLETRLTHKRQQCTQSPNELECTPEEHF